MIDGAHALGQLSLDLTDLNADFFVSNCHKWLCAPKGCAVLYAQEHVQSMLKPPITSHGSGAGFFSAFLWDGCRDYAPFLSIHTCMKVFRNLGEDRVLRYMHDTLSEAVSLLTTKWVTTTLAPRYMAGSMALVGLPRSTWPADQAQATSTDAKYMQDLLHLHHAIECPVKCIMGRLYVRISVHVYNELKDYERLGEAVSAIAAAAAKQG